MNRTFTTSLPLLLAALVLLLPSKAMAQDVEVTGYYNVNLTIKAATAGSGKVFVSPQETSMMVFREQFDFKQPIPLVEFMGAQMTAFLLYAQPNSADGYIFAGWYRDNGDGVFNPSEDEIIGEEVTFTMLATLPDDAKVYETSAAAKSGEFPAEPTDLIWAYFSRGARVSISYMQGDEYDTNGKCGSVRISKTVNEPGDVITVTAYPNDGFHFEYWADSLFLGDVVSRENPYRFTVKGGEQLYAYFSADNAPEFDLPAEGGFKVAYLNAPWVLHDESAKNGAHVLVLTPDDMKRTADGKVYLDMENEDTHIDIGQFTGLPTLISGKGKVRFAFKIGYGYSRPDDLVKWSGDKGVTLSGDVIYVYVFVEELGAFVMLGTTDEYNPNWTKQVEVPAQLAYFQMSAFDLTDDYGNIPTVIGLSPATFDKGMASGTQALHDLLAGIEGVKVGQRTLNGQRVFSLSGVQVKATAQKGVYIVNGRKVVLKK